MRLFQRVHLAGHHQTQCVLRRRPIRLSICYHRPLHNFATRPSELGLRHFQLVLGLHYLVLEHALVHHIAVHTLYQLDQRVSVPVRDVRLGLGTLAGRTQRS